MNIAMNLEIDFHQDNECSVFLEGSVIDAEDQLAEILLFSCYTIRQLYNIDQGKFAYNFASMLIDLSKAGDLMPTVLEDGEVKLIRYPGHSGRKRFLCKLLARDSGVAFDLKAKGFGILARGVGYYASIGSVMLMLFLARRNHLDKEFLIKLSTAARLCGEAFLTGRITAQNQLEVVFSITGQVSDEYVQRALRHQQ